VALLGLAAAVVTKNRALLACAAIVALGTAYVVIVGGDWMPLFRFMVPLLPFAYVATGIALRAAIEQRHLFVNLGLAALAVVTLVHRVGREANDVEHIVTREKGFWDRAAGGTAAWFTQREASRGRDQTYGTIALGDIGQVGYETGYPIFDVLGLVDPVIGKLPGGYTKKTGPGYRDHFFTVKPRYFVMISKADCRSPTVPTSVALYGDPRFAKEYYVAGSVRLESHAWCIWERRDAPGAEPGKARSPSGPRRSPLLRPGGALRLPPAD
jgi:arabinofuranosyltransferase